VSQAERFIECPGARLRIVVDAPDDAPDAPPITMLASALVNLHAWDAMTPRLVGAGYRVLRYDYRGFGGSTAEAADFSNRADLRAVLDDLGIERTAVVGNSYGAMIALDSVLEMPERFVALVWVGGGIGGYQGGYEDLPEELELFEAYDKAETAGDIDAMVDLDIRIWVDGIGQPPDRVSPEIREMVRTMDRPHVAPDRVTGKPISLEPWADERLDAIAVPTLVVVGELDTSGTRRAAERLATSAPDARLESWPGIAHMVGMEAPERLADAIVDFLAPLARWR
jgi:pimeloyl-ACP methyl ester carboxylesterase